MNEKEFPEMEALIVQMQGLNVLTRRAQIHEFPQQNLRPLPAELSVVSFYINCTYNLPMLKARRL